MVCKLSLHIYCKPFVNSKMRYFACSHSTFAAKYKKPTPGGDKKVGQSANHQKNNEETLLFSHSMLRRSLWRSKCPTTRWQE